MHTEHPIPPELRAKPFTVAQGRELLSRRRLDGDEFGQPARGTRWVADDPDGPSYGRRLQGVLARRRRPAVLLGPSAAWAHGCELADPELPVHLSGPSHRARDDVIRHRAVLRAADVVMTPWGPATSLTRTAVDLARGVGTDDLPHGERVAWIDALLHATSLTAGQARRSLGPAVGLRGLDTARSVLRDARDGVHSPKETALRLLIIAAGFPEPATQCPVRWRGRTIAHLDLGWEQWRAGVEYDGAVHRERRQHSKDLDRHNGIRAAQWRVLQVDSWLLARPARLVDRLWALVPEHDRR